MKRNLSLSLAKTISRNNLFPNHRGYGACLNLGGLRSYTSDALTHLGGHYANVCFADLGFEKLAAADLEKLIRGNCHQLILDYLISIDIDLAKAIRYAIGDRGFVRLTSAMEIEIDVLDVLLSNQTSPINDIALNIGVPSICDESAERLSLYSGLITIRINESMPSLKQLKTLAQYKGCGLDVRYYGAAPEHYITEMREACSPDYTVRCTLSEGETLLEIMSIKTATEGYGHSSNQPNRS